jgi:DNA-binding transcriptional LysR family regulator
MSRQFSDLVLGSIEIFCLAAELESFTVAATRAGLTPAAVSRSISRLEQRLGVRLFTRTTRQIKLTDSGRSYFEKCRRALGELIEAEREAAGKQTHPSGLLRISLPTSYGHARILPLIPAFRARFPNVNIDVNLTNRNVDFTAEGFDLVVRGRLQADSGLVARKLEDCELVVVAAPAYLAEFGEPKSLDALTEHECLQFLLPSTGMKVPWLFRRNGEDVEIVTDGGLTCSGDITGNTTLARNGGGLLQTFRFLVHNDLASGRLVEVMKPFGGATRPFSIMYPANRYLPSRMRVFIDFLCGELSQCPKMQAELRAKVAAA